MHFLHNPLTMASGPTTPLLLLSQIIPSLLLIAYFLSYDFSDACTTTEHSVLENPSSLVFCNSMFSPLCFSFSCVNALPIPNAYSLNAGLTQELHSHLILYNSVSAMPSITILQWFPYGHDS